MTRRGLLASSLAAAQTPSRPNVLLVMADAWRGQALPSASDPNLVAPHLKRLAAEGMWCSRAYTSYPVCCPSRAAMWTGRLPHAAGVIRNHTRLPLDQPTMSAAFKHAGYRTGYIGKFHLDGRESPGFVPPERRRGFDYWAAFNLAHRHYDAVYYRDSPEPVPMSGFEPDRETELAVDFIKQKSSQPFFLCLSWVAPHAPFTPPPRWNGYEPAKLRLRENVPARSEVDARRDLAGYYGLCSALDENLGLLLAELDRQGLAKSTVVVFTSDHGETLGSHGVDEIDLPYEESSRIPLLIRYPLRFEGGSEFDGLASNIDLAPTLLGLCGLPQLEGTQGVDLFAEGVVRSESIYCEGQIGQPGEWRMVVRGLDKLVVNAALKPTHLFNLGQDPYELKNLAEEGVERRKVDELSALIRRWAFRTGDRVGR